jgi:hypothetical protein
LKCAASRNQEEQVMTAVENKTLTFAKQILQIGQDGLTNADHEQLRRLILDLLGVCYIGATLSTTRDMIGWAESFGGSGDYPDCRAQHCGAGERHCCAWLRTR